MKLKSFGGLLLAFVMTCIGMAPFMARADSVQTPRVSITCSVACQANINRYYLDMTVAMADLAELLTPYSNYSEFHVFTDSPSYVAANNSFDTRCNSTTKPIAGSTKHDSPAQEQKDKATGVLNAMALPVESGGMGTTAFNNWFDKLPKQNVNTAGGMIQVKVMTLIWNNGSSTSFAVFSGSNPGSTSGVYIGNQNVIDPKPTPAGESSACA